MAVLALALAASACNSNGIGGAYAAKVGSSEISEDEFLRELAQFRENAAAAEAFQLSGGEGAVSADIAASWLNVLVQDALVAMEFERRDLSLTEGETRNAEQLAVQQFGGEQVWDGFDQWFRTRVAERLARIIKLQESIGGEVSEAELRAEFERTRDDLERRVCVKHILVESQEQAAALKAEIDAGGSFAEIAQANSIDPGSGAQGGDLGCHPRGTFVGPFEDAAWSLPEAQLSEPVETQFGWHLILVESRGAPAFEDVREELAGRLQAESQQAFAETMNDLLAGLDVDVNPKYGSFDPSGASGGFVQVPPVPQVSDGPPSEEPIQVPGELFPGQPGG